MSFNVQGLTTNFLEVQQLLHTERPQIVCLNETHITTDIQDAELNIPGYQCFICYSNSRHTGGVVIYVSNNLKVTVLSQKVSVYNYWSLLIKVNFPHREMIIGSIYRSPNGNIDEFLNFFEES